jgi:hypothetical protein
MNTKAEVENVLDTTDTSNLRASFYQALSITIPPLTLYRNYRPSGYSNLIFGVPLVDHAIDGNVPKVMRMCMEEIEKRGFNIAGLYTVSLSRRVLGFILSVPGQSPRLRWHKCTGGQWNAAHQPIYQLTKLTISCDAGLKVKSHFPLAPQTT